MPMQYRKMPNSVEKLSALGYGCMRLPNRMGRIDRDKALKQIRGAIDKGVNYLDTAYVYHGGASETFLGEYVLKDGYREKVNIATKLPCQIIDKAEGFEEIFNKQLERLQVDCIDYYLLHGINGVMWRKMLTLGIVDFMDKLKEQGKIRYMGFSFHGSKNEFVEIVDGYEWDFTQVQYNILDEHFQAGAGGIEYAHSKGLGIIVMEPLRGGSLIENIPNEARKLYDSAPTKRSPADWALRWIWNNPAITVVLSGMNDDDNIAENIKVALEAYPNGLSESEISLIDKMRQTYNMQIGCTGCAYCMPCPAGIDIPAAFRFWNRYSMGQKMDAYINHAYAAAVRTADGKVHWANSCMDCGQCEKKCPQGIQVRQSLKLVHRDLEGVGTRAMAAVIRCFQGGSTGV